MNCKPGDLAIIVTTCGSRHLDHCIGTVVEVVRSGPTRAPFGLMWEVEHPQILRVADACLKPIRDPGDDEQDESARYLPPVPQVSAPMVTKEAA